MDKQRPAEYVFSSQVQMKLSEIRAAEAEERAKSRAQGSHPVGGHQVRGANRDSLSRHGRGQGRDPRSHAATRDSPHSSGRLSRTSHDMRMQAQSRSVCVSGRTLILTVRMVTLWLSDRTSS